MQEDCLSDMRIGQRVLTVRVEDLACPPVGFRAPNQDVFVKSTSDKFHLEGVQTLQSIGSIGFFYLEGLRKNPVLVCVSLGVVADFSQIVKGMRSQIEFE